tara:strand:- start:2369 stop:3664 length:1296 start_codon:yes stop_codon:yes gene_type:complete
MGFFDNIWEFVSGTETEAGSNNLLSYAFYDDEGNLDFAKTAGLLGGIASTTGLLGSDGTPAPVGYQGTIPDYDATRSRVANTYDPTRRAGSGGQRYFSDMRFTPKEVIDDEFVTQASSDSDSTSRDNQVIDTSPPPSSTPITKNPDIEAGYYDSPEFKNFIENESTGIGTRDIRFSPYFGRQNSGSIGSAADAAYEAYLNRSGNTGFLQGGDQFKKAEDYIEQEGGKLGLQTGIGSVNPAVTNARSSGDQQALGLEALNASNLARQSAPADVTPYVASNTVAADTSGPASGVVNLLPAMPDYTGDSLRDAASKYISVSDNYITPYSNNVEMGRGSYAAGGIAKLREGRYLSGATDGMADKVPASIEQVQPAALSDGEYVIPADVVSHLGNGNSDAGAKVLDTFLTKIRKSRTGNGKQGKEIDPNKLLPKVA